MARPASQAEEQDQRRARPGANRRRPRSPVADRTSDATTAAASSVRAAIVAIDAASRDGEEERRRRGSGGRRAAVRPSAVVAGRGEPAAAGHLADQPAEPEGDREPADERPREAAARATEALVGQGTRDVGRGATEVGRRRSSVRGARSAARLRPGVCVARRRAGERGRSRAAVLGRIRLAGRARRRVPPGRGRVGRVGRAAAVAAGRLAGSPSAVAAAPRRPAPSVAGAGSPPRARAARRARAWYSGPCLRGSAYSFGLSVQYVPLVVPYQLAPPQSGSNGSSSAPSYDVEPSVALFGARGFPPGGGVPGVPESGRGS